MFLFSMPPFHPEFLYLPKFTERVKDNVQKEMHFEKQKTHVQLVLKKSDSDGQPSSLLQKISD